MTENASYFCAVKLTILMMTGLFVEIFREKLLEKSFGLSLSLYT